MFKEIFQICSLVTFERDFVCVCVCLVEHIENELVLYAGNLVGIQCDVQCSRDPSIEHVRM